MSEEITGFINGYRWGIDYPTNGEEPDLPGDVITCIDNSPIQDRADMWVWGLVKSFRVVDSRYKPADTSYLENNNLAQVDDTDVVESEWYDYDNQKAIALPPVATEVIAKVHKEFNCYFVGKNSLGNLVIELANGEFSCFHAFQIDFKPLDHNRKVEAKNKTAVDAPTVKESFTAENSDIPRFNYRPTQFKLVDDSKPQNKYDREIIGKYGTGKCTVDVYRVLDAFKTDSAAIDHAVKKLLCAGSRGAKDRLQDLREAMLSIEAEIDLQSDKQMECKQ